MVKPKIGIIGLGNMGSLHLKVAKTLLRDKVDIVAVCDVDRYKLRYAEEYGVQKLYKNYTDMLEKEELDGVIIATPPYAHREQAIYALRKGLYVLLEKPMATNLKDAEEIARYANNRLMVAFSLRYHGLYNKVKHYLETKLGNVVVHWHIALGRIPSMPWISDKELSGGMVTENSIHVLYVFYWYAGKVREVYASLWRLTPNVTIEDNASIILKHENDATSILVHSWSASHRWRKWGIQAEKGTITCEGYLGGEYMISYNKKIIDSGIYEEPIEEMYRRQLEEFIESIMNNRKPLTNEEHGIHIHRVIQAIYESAQKKKLLRIN